MHFIWQAKPGVSTCTGGRIQRFVLHAARLKTFVAADAGFIFFRDYVVADSYRHSCWYAGC
jgi:hypothetical protein